MATDLTLHPGHHGLKQPRDFVLIVGHGLGADARHFADLKRGGIGVRAGLFEQARAVVEGIIDGAHDEIFRPYRLDRLRCAANRLQEFLRKSRTDHDGTRRPTEVSIIAEGEKIGQKKAWQTGPRSERGHGMDEHATEERQSGLLLKDGSEQHAMLGILGKGFLKMEQNQGPHALADEKGHAALGFVADPGDHL